MRPFDPGRWLFRVSTQRRSRIRKHPDHRPLALEPLETRALPFSGTMTSLLSITADLAGENLAVTTGIQGGELRFLVNGLSPANTSTSPAVKASFVTELEITGSSAADTITVGGPGIVFPNLERITIDAGGGSDVIAIVGDSATFPALRQIIIRGDFGDDTIDLSGLTATGISVSVDGGLGNDTLLGSNFLAMSLVGGAGDDTLVAGNAGDFLDGGSDNDSLVGGTGSDELAGGAGNDILTGGLGADRADGGAGDDTIEGGDGDDNLVGGDGNDILRGGIGDDFLDGSAGDDILTGAAGDDTLLGAQGNDTLEGQDGDDGLAGEEGDDYLVGSAGVDTLIGGAGNDRLEAGLDADFYAFAENWGIDFLLDSGGATTIDFSAVTIDLDLTFENDAIPTGAVVGGNALSGRVEQLARVVTGPGSDVFRFLNRANINPGTIDGGGNVNSIDYTYYNAPASADLPKGTADGTGGARNINWANPSSRGGDIVQNYTVPTGQNTRARRQGTNQDPGVI